MDKPMEEALGTSRDAELLLPGGLIDVLGPRQEVLIGKGPHISALWQIVQGLLVDNHQVGGLHQGDVNLLSGHPALGHQDRADGAARGDTAHIRQRVGEGRKIPVQAAENRYLTCTGLVFGFDPGGKLCILNAEKFHRDPCFFSKWGEDLIAHKFAFSNRGKLSGHPGNVRSGRKNSKRQNT